MSKFPIIFAASLCAGLLSLSIGANAALIPALDGQIVNDTDLNIAWLADANYPLTLGYVNGQVNWSGAKNIIDFMNTSHYLGYNDWRFPIIDSDCSSYNGYCSGGELGHLFYNELGGEAGSSIRTTHNANYSLFKNLEPQGYWSGNLVDYQGPWNINPMYWYAAYGSARYFYLGAGIQSAKNQYEPLYMMAVHPGQIQTTPEPTTGVPEPATYALIIAGYSLMGFRAYRRKISWRR